MSKIVTKEIFEKIITSPIFISFAVFVLFTLIIVGLTLAKVESAYDKEFIRDVFVEAHGMLFDILIIGTFIFALHVLVERRREKRREIKRYQEEIDDFRYWSAEEAKFRIVGNIRRLNRNGITKIMLRGAYLKETQLAEVKLQGADLSNSNLQKAILHHANLKGVNLYEANLQEAILVLADLEGADIRLANLQKADLNAANFKAADLSETRLQEADLKEANFNESNLSKANLKKSTIFRSSFQLAKFEKANLQQSFLIETDLRGSSFYRAELQGADFSETSFQEANLTEANLTRADLRGAVKLTIEQLSKVKTLFKAKLDSGHLKIIEEKYSHLLEEAKKEG